MTAASLHFRGACEEYLDKVLAWIELSFEIEVVCAHHYFFNNFKIFKV